MQLTTGAADAVIAKRRARKATATVEAPTLATRPPPEFGFGVEKKKDFDSLLNSDKCHLIQNDGGALASGGA
jgi:hypothetical protein